MHFVLVKNCKFALHVIQKNQAHAVLQNVCVNVKFFSRPYGQISSVCKLQFIDVPFTANPQYISRSQIR